MVEWKMEWNGSLQSLDWTGGLDWWTKITCTQMVIYTMKEKIIGPRHPKKLIPG